jgi:hypothetical protein
MEEQGVMIVPTVFIAKTTALDLKQLLLKHWKKAVPKAFSAGPTKLAFFDVRIVTHNRALQIDCVVKRIVVTRIYA